VRQSIDELASLSWRTLRERIAGEKAGFVREKLDFRFDFRESTRPPRRTRRG
jgi:hypothetical protein